MIFDYFGKSFESKIESKFFDYFLINLIIFQHKLRLFFDYFDSIATFDYLFPLSIEEGKRIKIESFLNFNFGGIII